MVRRLPEDLVFLSLSDPRESLPEFIERLPAYAQQMNGLMMPAVTGGPRGGSPRPVHQQPQADRPGACTTMKRVNGAFPRAAITDKEGKPLLSWRVAILPYIEQQTALSKVQARRAVGQPAQQSAAQGDAAGLPVPESSRRPSRSRRPTRCSRATVRCSRMARACSVREITDGTSNTIMAVEAKEAVPWTKPDDLSFDPAAPRPLSASRLAPSGRLQRGDGRRLGHVHREYDRPEHVPDA